MTHRQYVLLALSLMLVPLLLVSAVNLVADPLGIYHVLEKDGVNAIKPRAQRFERLLKPIRAQQLNPDILILGTSRSAYGIDPASPWLTAGGATAFNNAVMGSTLRDLHALATHGLLTTHARTLLVDIDFFMFNIYKDAPYQFPNIVKKTPGDVGYRASQWLVTLPSWDMLDASRATLTGQDEPERLTALGLMVNERKIAQYLRKGGMRTAADVTLMDYTRELWTPCPGTTYRYVHPDRGTSTWQAFDDLLALSEAHNAEIVLYTSPVHALLLATLDASGLWPTYEQWQRDLVAHLDAYRQAHANARIRFIDFAHINSVTAEPIPAEGDAETAMQWYVDPAHFRTEVGELMLATVFGDDSSVPANFTSAPTPDTVDAQLAAKRAALDAYLNNAPDMAAFAKDLAQRGLALRDQRGLDCQASK